MCGFVGISNPRGPISRDLLVRMRDRLTHRGPDDDGVHLADGIGLGFRRLSIIDLETGQQPIASEDGRVVLVFNGEIYNFLDLREELAARGASFHTRGDSEVILRAYEHWGEDAFQRLNGMFAIALWDGRSGTLYLARDRAGEKPLHYMVDDGVCVFGSELKGLLPHPAVSGEVDWLAFDEFFSYGFISAPRSIYRGVAKVRPGHLLRVRGDEVEERPYWRLDPSARFQGDYEEARTATRDLLESAVTMRMISDVPLGAFLSGGVDSSAVVALMAQNSSEPVRTFSIGFEEAEYDECRFARQVAERYATDHTELVVTPRYAELIEKIVGNFDEPFGDSSALPTYMVSALTREHVTVSLSGDGGDELFGGYDGYGSALRRARLVARIPGPLRWAAPFASRVLPEGTRLGRWARTAALDPTERFTWSLTHFQPSEKRALYADRALRAVEEAAGAVAAYPDRQKGQFLGGDRPYIQQIQYADFMHYLPDDILVKVDRTSMLVSLESRAPFLDHRVVEHAFSLPPAWKVTEEEKKIILKDALRDDLPASILDRAKMGFAVPIAHWFTDELYDFCRERILTDAVAAYLDLAAVEAYLREHRDGRRDHAQKLWFVLSFALWADRQAA